MSLLSVVTLRQAGAGADALVTGQVLTAQYHWTFLLGQALLPGINALLLGSLMYKSRLVPRVLPLLGLIGAPIIFASVLAKYFGVYDELSVWSLLGALPIAVWEFSLGVYLTVKGFKPCRITAEMTAEARPPEVSAVGPAPGTTATLAQGHPARSAADARPTRCGRRLHHRPLRHADARIPRRDIKTLTRPDSQLA